MFLKNKKENDYFLFQYIQGQLSEEDTKKLERHLEECDECEKILTEMMITEGIIDQAYRNKIKDISISEKEEKSELSIEDVLSNPEKLYKLSRDFLKENYPDEDLKEFDKFWNMIENEYDWERDEFKAEKISTEVFEKYKIAAYSDKFETSPDIISKIISSILTMRKLILSHKGITSKKELKKILKKLKIKSKEMINIIEKLWDFSQATLKR